MSVRTGDFGPIFGFEPVFTIRLKRHTSHQKYSSAVVSLNLWPVRVNSKPVLIFNQNLSATQQRNLSQELCVEVLTEHKLFFNFSQ